MSTFKITIQHIGELDDRGYPKVTTLYEQAVEDLNVQAVIAVANNLILPVDTRENTNETN